MERQRIHTSKTRGLKPDPEEFKDDSRFGVVLGNAAAKEPSSQKTQIQ